MSNVFDDMRTAIAEAETTLRAADRIAHDMARLLAGRLRHVPPWVLVKLKRELQNFDAQKKEWKP